MGRRVPSFFLTKKNGAASGDFDSLMYPFARFSSRNFCSSICSGIVSGYGFSAIRLGSFHLKSGIKSIAWSHSRLGG